MQTFTFDSTRLAVRIWPARASQLMDDTNSREQSFLELYEELAEPIYRHCYFRVSSAETAEDITQETFMRTWQYLAKGNHIDNSKAFLYRTAGNLIVDHYRHKKEVSLEALSENGYEPMGADAGSVVAHAEGEQARAILTKLGDPYKETMLLRYVDGFSVSDIADLLGESQNVVSVRLHRGVQKLKKIFHV